MVSREKGPEERDKNSVVSSTPLEATISLRNVSHEISLLKK